MPGEVPDLSTSEFQIGIEVEYPIASSFESRFKEGGASSSHLVRETQERGGFPSGVNCQVVNDPSVGLEVISDPLDLPDAPKWYADVIEHVEQEHNEPHNPVGLIHRGGGETAGLHLHLSPLSREQAEALFHISRTDWAKAMFCSSIASDDYDSNWSVFRGGRFCRMNFDSGNRYDCLNSRGDGHWEWRLPEPVTPEHFEKVVKFIRLFEENADDAVAYAQALLDDGDDSITSIRRAEEVGIDIEDEQVAQNPHPETADFFRQVQQAWNAPDIYRVTHTEFGEHYITETRLDDEVQAFGVDLGHHTVIDAETLEETTDDYVREEIRQQFMRRNSGEPPKTQATDFVKEIVKKKKGNA